MNSSIAILIHGDTNSNRNALTEEKYKDLATAFIEAGFQTESVLYNDEIAGDVLNRLLEFDIILVWVNPIEAGKDRKKLDEVLLELSRQGCTVSTHPGTILKIGTKDILFKTKDMEWGGETKMYTSFEAFKTEFATSLQQSGVKILKQYRGNGGNGVFKISTISSDEVMVRHAQHGDQPHVFSWNEFTDFFRPYLEDGGFLVEQEWNDNLVNGMVRCYLCGNKVAGFGYQEINALYETDINGTKTYVPPGKRYYFTENCGLFADLKEIMENKWVPQLQAEQEIADDMMPVIWDADFFINNIASPTAIGKYALCEINVSCVSPFPPSAIRFMMEEVQRRIQNKKLKSVNKHLEN